DYRILPFCRMLSAACQRRATQENPSPASSVNGASRLGQAGLSRLANPGLKGGIHLMNQRRARSLALLAMVAPLAWLAGVAPARAEEKTLWQIGNFDQSSEEFGSRIRF